MDGRDAWDVSLTEQERAATTQEVEEIRLGVQEGRYDRDPTVDETYALAPEAFDVTVQNEILARLKNILGN
jgi:hypothetical protein